MALYSLRALAWLVLTVCSAAAAEPRSAELVLNANPACVSVETLRARTASSAWRWTSAPEREAELSLAASVLRQTASGLPVVLHIRWRDGRNAQRSLAAQSCAAALDALALLIQMTLDAAEHSRAPGQIARDAPEPWWGLTQLVLGGNLGLGTGSAPALQPGVGVYAAMGLRGALLMRPWFQLELSHAWRNGVAGAGGRADFALDGGQVLACPVGFRAAALAAYGCAAIELARLRARGYDTYEPRTQARLWASAGLGLLLQARLLSWAELQLGASLLHPLRRDQFSFAPDLFYAVPAWRWQLKLGLAVCFL